MKKIVLIIVLMFCLNLIASDNQRNYVSCSYDLNLLHLTSSDSIVSVFERRPMILYMSGHRAHIWSIVLIKDDKYQVICGRVNSYGVNEIYEPIESNMIDTVAFLSAYRGILSWGFDSLPNQARQMKAVNATEYTPFFTNLSVIGQDSIVSFNTENAVAFSGPDSVEFNNRVKKLSYIMYWLAEPFVRKYTRDSVFCRKMQE